MSLFGIDVVEAGHRIFRLGVRGEVDMSSAAKFLDSVLNLSSLVMQSRQTNTLLLPRPSTDQPTTPSVIAALRSP